MAELYIKQGDDAPSVATTLLDGDGNAVNISNCEIVFVLRPVNDATILRDAAVNDQVGDGEDGTLGQAHYSWDDPIAYPPGEYWAEWEVTFPDDSIQTFPGIGYDSIQVVAELGIEEDPYTGPMNLITVAELAAHTERDLQNSAAAELYVEAASQAVRDFLDQQLDYVAEDPITMKGNDRYWLTLPEMPIIEIIEVHINDDDPLDPEDYEVVGRSGLHRIDGNKWCLGDTVHITYSHGYALRASDLSDAPRLPAPIRMKALELATGALSAGRVGVGGVIEEHIGEYSYRLGENAVDTDMVLDDVTGSSIVKYRQEGVA